MRKPLVLLAVLAVSAPYCVASSWDGWASWGTTPQAAPVVPTAVNNPAPSTTSPYNGFTATGTTSSYTGALTTIGSTGGSGWGAWGSSSYTASTVVDSTTTTGVSWAPQSTQPVTSSGASYVSATSGWGAWGGAIMVAQPSSTTPPATSTAGPSVPSYSAYDIHQPEPGTTLTVLGGMGLLFVLRRRSIRKKTN
jgi:hypothetical protein